jgi:CheY-like chemotaxis protein
MPIIDGFELAKKLLKQKKNKPLWLIAITADALSGSAEKCLATDFDDYIAKPCTQEIIANKLN